MKFDEILDVRLDLFDADMNTQTTTSADLSVEMKTHYATELITLAEAELVHDQFGQDKDIPQHGGKTIEFRQFDPLPEALEPLVEGVTPDGQSMSAKSIEATVKQYGGYITLSDIVQLTTIDPILVEATRQIASQAGRTLDTITREVLNSGTVVQFCDGRVDSRDGLYYTDKSDNCNLNVDAIKRAVRYLENQDAPKINGKYVGIIHPDCKYDIMNDPDWKDPHTYVDTENIYDNEIGQLYGVRFVEATRAKAWKPEDLAPDARELALSAAANNDTTVGFAGGTVAAGDLVGRQVLIGGTVAEVVDNTANSLTLDTPVTAAANDPIYPGEGGAGGCNVYSTLILASDAYGITKLSGGGLEHIVKQLGSAGTADPLNQRGTVGWKATKVAEILVQQYLVRIETTATP